MTIAAELPNPNPMYRTPSFPYLQQLSGTPGASDTYYAYDRMAGSQSIVYVVDSGFSLSPYKFQHAVNYLDIRPTIPRDDKYGQGNIVAAMAVGSTQGVAPQASLVSVKLLTGGFGHRLRMANYLNALITTLEDIVKKGKQNKAVISLALRKYIYSSDPCAV